MARTGEGRLRAKARGVRFGRPRSLTPHQRQEAMQRLADGEVQADLARSYGVSTSAGYRVTALSRSARPPSSEAVRAGGSTAQSPLIGHREPLSLPKTQSIRGQQRIRT
jgi:DNA invertase Pin-like site-specific DNA recombinase